MLRIICLASALLSCGQMGAGAVDEAAARIDAKALRLAERAYPVPEIFTLWKASQQNPEAADAFMAAHRGEPILHDVPGDDTKKQVTFYTLTDELTQYAMYSGGPDFGGLVMTRVGQTNLHFVTLAVPNDARFRYSFNHYRLRRSGAIEERDVINSGDFILEMPGAPLQLAIEARAGVAKGTLEKASLRSAVLQEKRDLLVYKPAAQQAHKLLIVFDGEAYSADPGQADRGAAWVPTPTILDNLTADGVIPPTAAVFVSAMRQRTRDLPSPALARFVAEELLPWTERELGQAFEARDLVAVGSSRGGFAAAQLAMLYPDRVGNVLSQSGSFWVNDAIIAHEQRTGRTVPYPMLRYPEGEGKLIGALKAAERLPIKFYLEVGRYDLGVATVGSNRQLRDVLEVKGYDVTYREYNGAHAYLDWRGSLATGLTALLAE